MSVDLFDTRTMLEIIEQRKPVRTFLLNTFFRTTVKFNTESVDVDIVKGRRRLAPFVNPRREGKVIEKRGFTTRSYKPAYVKPKMVTTAEDILKRQPGNIIYSPNSGPAQMAAEELGRNLGEMDEMITRREEWMAAQALTTGKVLVVGEGVDDELDFLFSSTHLPILTGTDLWSDHTNATPLDDLKLWKRLVSKDSGIAPSICVMGLSTIDNFLKCDQVMGSATKQGVFNMINVQMGRINPQILPDGVIYYGSLQELGLDVYTYEEWYVDDNDDIEYPMMPDNKVLLGNPSARSTRLYGAIKDLDALAPAARFPKSWKENDPSARLVMLQSAPLMAPLQPDAFLCADVI